MTPSLNRIGAILRNTTLVLLRDPMPVIILIGMPSLLMPFVVPAFRVVMLPGATEGIGPAQVVPGLGVFFGFFLSGFVGFSFFREHGWGTWLRLRISPVSQAEIVIGKLVPYLILGLAQFAVLFTVGYVAFGLRIHGSVTAVVLSATMYVACVVACGMAMVAFCSTIEQLNTLMNLSAIVLGGVGGALSPIDVLPPWLSAVSPLSPTYWAMRAFRAALTDPDGVKAVALPLAVLGGFTIVFVVAAAARFRATDVKRSFAN